MTLQEKLFEIISQRREEPKVEFKETLNLSSTRNQAEFAKLVMAIANTRGWDGYIIIGVKDKRNCPSDSPQDYIVGFSAQDPDGFERTMNQVLANYCDPIPEIKYKEFTYPDLEKKFGVVIVPRSSSRPHLSKRESESIIRRGVIYIRRGAMVAEADHNEIHQMIKKGEKAVTVINFAHPFRETLDQLEKIIGCRIEEFISRPMPTLELEEGFESQINNLIKDVPLTSE
ncbi:ATP-binding protein, partial [Dehalococcoidales bacterium]|nr:ATP-binding protein [Dehalococcoidales bacterium]